MKMVRSIRLVGIFLSMSFGLPTNSHPQRKLLNNTISPLSHNDHPDIKGFSYSYGNVDAWKVIDDTTGYVYFHNDVYFMEISPVSKLFLIRVQADFTPSSQANKNGNKSYDSRFDLFSGYIHTNVYQKYDGNKRSSSIKIKKFWPKSDDDFTANITSSFGVTYNFSSLFGVEADFSKGVSVKAETSSGFTLSYSKSVAISKPEPVISAQNEETVKQAQWYYEFSDRGTVTYALETFYMFEAKNDGYGYQPYSFGFDIDVEMNNVAYRHYWWEQHDINHYTLNESYGLYA